MGITVNVNIEGVTLPMTVATTEEERLYRQAATLVNNRLHAMRERYPDLPSDNYYFSMVLLNTAVEALRNEGKTDAKPVADLINSLEKEIDEL